MNRRYVIYVSAIALLTSGFLYMTWRRRSANVAERFLNVHEVGSNQDFDSSVFKQMLKSVGWQGGEAYCMYLAKAVYMNAFPSKADKIDKILTGSSQGSWKAAKENPDVFITVTDGLAHVGDIAIWQDVNNAKYGHAAIVKKRLGPGQYNTIEGNTSFEQASAGEGVAKKTRKLVPGTIDGNLKFIGLIRLKNFL